MQMEYNFTHQNIWHDAITQQVHNTKYITLFAMGLLLCAKVTKWSPFSNFIYWNTAVLLLSTSYLPLIYLLLSSSWSPWLLFGVHGSGGVGRQAGLLGDPAVVVGQPCVHARLVPLSTAVAPADHPVEEGPAPHLAHQGAPRVSLGEAERG